MIYPRRSIVFVFYFALAAGGQAAVLQMIQAGKVMGYQHYRPLESLLQDTPTLALTFFAIQIFCVGAGIFRHREIWGGWIRRAFKRWQIMILGASLILPAATVSPEVEIYLKELVFASFVALVQMGNLMLVAGSAPDKVLMLFRKGIEYLDKPPGLLKRFLPKTDHIVLFSAMWVTASAAGLNLTVYQNHPHIPDEVVYLYQARMLAEGDLYKPAPPVPEAFSVYLMKFDESRWYPAPPVGWPAALALGTLVGAPWLVNPLFAGGNIILAYLILKELYDRRLARIAAVLLSLSPWFVFMGMNFMTHTFTLTCALLAVLAVIWARQTGQSRWAWAAGLALGVCSLIRPMEALILAGLLGLWALGIGDRRLSVYSLVGLVVSTGIVAGLVLPYNQILTGDWRIFPINLYTDERFGVNSNAYGFGPDRGMGWLIDPFPGHSVLDGLVNANLNTFQVNMELFGWSTGSLWPVILFLVLGGYLKSDWKMLALIGSVFGAFFFYYFSGGPDFGARYWFLMVVPLVALTVRGLINFEQRLNVISNPDLQAGTRIWLGVAVLCLSAQMNFFPWRIVDKYYHYLQMRPDIRRIAEDETFGRSLVFIQGSEHPDYASAAVYNPLDFSEPVPIYAWDRGPAIREEVMQAFSDRPVWFVKGPTVTGDGFKISAGPIPASELKTGEYTIP